MNRKVEQTRVAAFPFARIARNLNVPIKSVSNAAVERWNFLIDACEGTAHGTFEVLF